MQSFRRIALLSTIATYFVIFAGGLVRVSGAGLGCPDWPKCFGRWVPPLHVSQIPAGVDSANFNLTLAWIEYFNRLGGVLLGFLVLAAAWLAIRYHFRNRRILLPTLGAALLVAVQGWLGSAVVASELEPVIVTIHMVLALVIVSLLVYATQESYRGPAQESRPPVYPARIRFMVGILWLLSILQVILGTRVREALEHTAAAYPLWSTARWMAAIGVIDDIHMILGVTVASLTAYAGYAALKLSERPTPLVRHSAWGLIIVVVAQAGSGVALMVTHLQPLVDIFHLWLASLYIGLLLVLFVGVAPRAEQPVRQPRGFSRVLGLSAAAAVLLAVIAYGVVAKAERSRQDIPAFGRVPEFSFTERTGRPFGSADLRGKINVVDFIFTSCRGACATMCAEMRRLYELYEHSDLVQFVSVDVDPATDSLPVMREFLEGYGVTDQRWVFLRGDIDSVAALAENGFKVSSEFPGLHSTHFILVDPEGEIRGYYEHSDVSAMDRLEQDIRTLARNVT